MGHVQQLSKDLIGKPDLIGKQWPDTYWDWMENAGSPPSLLRLTRPYLSMRTCPCRTLRTYSEAAACLQELHLQVGSRGQTRRPQLLLTSELNVTTKSNAGGLSWNGEIWHYLLCDCTSLGGLLGVFEARKCEFES